MKGTQTCINKVIKAIKVVQHFGDGSSSKAKADNKGVDDIFDLDDSPHEAASPKHGKWTTKCIKAGGKGKASADRLLKAAKGRTLSQVLSQTSKRLEPPSYTHAHHHGHPSSTPVDHKHPHSTAKSKPPTTANSKSDSPIQILMWIGDQHIDIGKTLVPY